jgi:hypothetical protein
LSVWAEAKRSLHPGILHEAEGHAAFPQDCAHICLKENTDVVCQGTGTAQWDTELAADRTFLAISCDQVTSRNIVFATRFPISYHGANSVDILRE